MNCQRCRVALDIAPGDLPTRWCNQCAQTILAEAETLEEYAGTDGRRQWAENARTWLYPGDKVLVINTNPPR